MSEILLIDNDMSAVSRIEFNLEQTGFSVRSTSCVLSALEEARFRHPDIILVAELLPGLDAFDLLELKRYEAEISGIPVVVMSSSTRNKLELLRAGCDDFMLIPLDEGELELRLRALLRRKEPGGLSGTFAEVGLVELVQMLMAARSSGEMKIQISDQDALIYVDQGQVCHACYRHLEGEEAFLAILRDAQDGGSFNFSSSNALAMHKTIQKRTDHLLLGLANILDEELSSSK